MRKGLWLGLIVVLVSGVMAPQALAGSTTTRRDFSNVINVYWHDKEQLSDGRYLMRTWYAGVYVSKRGTWSDLYESVDRCRKTDDGGTRCRQESYRVGISDLEGQTFEMDTENLDSAHLDAVYQLRAYDRNGDIVGGRVPTHIVADLTGVRDVRRHHDTYTYRYGWNNCSFTRETYDSAYRKATATGAIDGVDLGTTRDAFLSTSTSTVLNHRC